MIFMDYLALDEIVLIYMRFRHICRGRLPAKTEEAKVLVDKIIHYETSAETFGD